VARTAEADGPHLRALEGRNIGREYYPKSAYVRPLCTGISRVEVLLKKIRRTNPLRAHIAASYLCEIREAVREISNTSRRTSRVFGRAVEERVFRPKQSPIRRAKRTRPRGAWSVSGRLRMADARA
jgi:hypothetical protein